MVVLSPESTVATARVGFRAAARAVAPLIDGSGRTVVLGASNGAPEVTADPDRVLASLRPAVGGARLVLQVLTQAAAEVTRTAGGGAAHTVVLADALLESAARQVAAGTDPVLLRSGLTLTSEAVLAGMVDRAHPTSPAELRRVVDTALGPWAHAASASGAPSGAIGPLVVEAIAHCGPACSPSVVPTLGHAQTPTLEVGTGMVLDTGRLSPSMVTDRGADLAEMYAARVLLYDGPVRSADELLPLLGRLADGPDGHHPLLLVADRVASDALAVLVVNHLQGPFRVVAVAAPHLGVHRRARLDEVAALTGASVLGLERGVPLQAVTPDLLGRAHRVQVDGHRCLVEGHASGDDAARDRWARLRVPDDGVLGQAMLSAVRGTVAAARAAAAEGVLPASSWQDAADSLAGVDPAGSRDVAAQVVRNALGVMAERTPAGSVLPLALFRASLRAACSVTGLLVSSGGMVLETASDRHAAEVARHEERRAHQDGHGHGHGH